LNERLGLDAFRQAQQNAVNHPSEQFLRPVAATGEQLHNAG